VAALATEAVLGNLVVFGSVNANRRHYYRAARALAAADRGWLEQLVTRRIGLDDVQEGLQRAPEDIKVIMEFAQP
jgi:glucose 1-dehydrogenase